MVVIITRSWLSLCLPHFGFPFREHYCFHFGNVSAFISGALVLPFWERCSFHAGTTTFWEILPELFLLIPLSKFLAGIFSRKRWWWPIPQVMNQVFLHGSMVLKGFAGSSPCFVSLVCSFQIWCPKPAKISYRTPELWNNMNPYMVLGQNCQNWFWYLLVVSPKEHSCSHQQSWCPYKKLIAWLWFMPSSFRER